MTARIAPPVVTIGEPSGLVAEVSPVRFGRGLTIQRQSDGVWTTVATATTDAAGRYFLPLDTTTSGVQSFRVIAAPQGQHARAFSKTVTLKVYSADACSNYAGPVDQDALPFTHCLLARLDRWKSAGLMGVGQQLNVSTQDYLEPLTLLEPQHVSVVGFDLEEVRLAGSYEYPFKDAVVTDLLRLSEEGAVLTASWHPRNPQTGGAASDRSWHNLGALLQDTAAADAFWADYDELLTVLLRLQSGDDGAHPPAAVVFRPLHEANGNWFWWGKPTASVYRKVWARMQSRAAWAGVHNILWAYSFNVNTGAPIANPATLLPAKVDIGGIDSYDPEIGRGEGTDRFDLRGYADVSPRISRMAITEAGPHGSVAGYWDPAVITRTVVAQKLRPLWAMLWFDDGSGSGGITGKKQLSSLKAGRAWLRSCANGFCSLR